MVPDTRPFLAKSCTLRRSRNTSASSISIMAFQVVASWSASPNPCSTEDDEAPRSPAHTLKRGCLQWSATLSVTQLSAHVKACSDIVTHPR